MEENKERIPLKELLAIHNIQQNELAVKLNVTPASISQWVNGKVPGVKQRRKFNELYPGYDILWGSVI